MKNIFLIIVFYFIVYSIDAQQSSGKKIDVATGKEILKMFPQKMQDQSAIDKNDKVVKSLGSVGVVVHRNYGTGRKVMSLEVINNSLSVTNVNAAIAKLPNNNQGPDNNSVQSKVIQINGYKGLMQPYWGEAIKSGYELLIPVGISLISFRAFEYTEDEFLNMSNTIPVATIAQKLK